ncbi:hypothetical protein ACIBBE_23880 [Streptomyces sp. NPDC051644]|uniref:hypothetical protein n=1 Tax=Streptomyces sp. NPDC051644 TaxID=3365666 RepID=UPI0037B0292B
MQSATVAITALGTTVLLTPMSSGQLGDWDFVTETLRGVGPVRAYIASHPQAGQIGVILQKGRDCRAEWKHTDGDEYLYAGSGRTLVYVLAHILRERISAGVPVGQPLPERHETPNPGNRLS